jgi:hypothetical protein
MPDLDALAAQAASMPMGAGAGVKFVTPKNSMLQFRVNDAGKAESLGLGGPAICGFAIPLITIVATFVLRLFLPIVVFLFGLWWMLRLRFCIPPVLTLDDAGLAERLVERMNNNLDLDVEPNAVTTALNGYPDPPVSAGLIGAYPNNWNVLGKLVVDMSTDFSASAPADLADAMEVSEDHKGAPGHLPSRMRSSPSGWGEGLEYYAYQSPKEVPSS